jgi:hypothetical protein
MGHTQANCQVQCVDGPNRYSHFTAFWISWSVTHKISANFYLYGIPFKIQLTLPSRLLVGKLIHIQSVEKLLPFCGTPRLVTVCKRWFKYDRDWLCVNKSQCVPIIFQPPCTREIQTHPLFTLTFCFYEVLRFVLLLHSLVHLIVSSSLSFQSLACTNTLKADYTRGKPIPAVRELRFHSLLYKTLNIKTYITIIRHIVLYVVKTWSIKLLEQHRPRVLCVLRKTFEPGREKRAEELR